MQSLIGNLRRLKEEWVAKKYAVETYAFAPGLFVPLCLPHQTTDRKTALLIRKMLGCGDCYDTCPSQGNFNGSF